MSAGVSAEFAFGLAAMGAVLLAIAEWRRVNRRNCFARIVASIAAVAALCLLGIHRIGSDEQSPATVREALLWTSNGGGGADENLALPQFALPGVTRKPNGATTVPDVAYLLREHPELQTLRIVGDGLEPLDLDALAHVNLAFDKHPGEPPRPTVRVLQTPRAVALGQMFRVQGHIAGLPPGETVTLTLIGPDEAKTETEVRREAEGLSKFDLAAGVPPATGHFAWRLIAHAGPEKEVILDEQIGVAVAPAVLPRLLIIDSAPRLDTAHLERWFGELGAKLTARTAVAQGRYRFATRDDSRAEFDALTRELLDQFDVLITDAMALNAFTPEELRAIEAAIAEGGLGLLVLSTAEHPATGREQLLFPWRFERDDSVDAPGEARTARLRWHSQMQSLEHPVSIENLRLQLSASQQPLITDTQHRPIVGTFRHGRGQIAVSIARDTWRWRLQDQSPAFAGYWSHLLTELSRARGMQEHRWSIENAESVPIAANRPVELRLDGPDEMPREAYVSTEGEQQPMPLALAKDPTEPRQWRTTFWARNAGWHRVQLGSAGAQLDFFVHETGAWASLGPERRALATARASRRRARSEQASHLAEVRVRSGAAPTVALYALFLLSAGYLWFERRRVAA